MFSAINRQVKRMALRYQRGRPIVRISDTTLRDGLQAPGVRIGADERVAIAKLLAGAGIHSLDCGFPASNAAEFEGVRRVAKEVDGPMLCAHSRTKKEDIDAAAKALEGVSPFKKVVGLFVGVSPLHREHKLGMTRPQIIETIVKSIEYASKHFELISFGAEDASRTEPEFLSEVYENAIQAGALNVGFADTVGILTPEKAAAAVKRIQDTVRHIDDAMIGVHFHNDLGLGTANAIAAIRAGAHTVQGTVNGMGERAGNTAIEEVVMALVLHQDEFKRTCAVDPGKLFNLCETVARLTGFVPSPNKAVVGRNIFRTETGLHQDGQLKHQDMYMPFPPALVGAGPVELILGPNSGRSAVRYHLEALGMEPSDEHVQVIMNYLKNGEHSSADQAEVRGFLERVKPFLGDQIAEEGAAASVEAPPEPHAAARNGVPSGS